MSNLNKDNSKGTLNWKDNTMDGKDMIKKKQEAMQS